jgi:putative ATPase
VPQDYLGAARKFYEPTEQGSERKIKERVEKWRSQIEASRAKGAPGGEK